MTDLFRQEKLIEKLIKFRLRKYGFSLIKIECYNRFDGDSYMCRLELYRGGNRIENRIMKFENKLTMNFVEDVELSLREVLT